MKMRFNNRFFRWGITAFLVIAASILLYYFVFMGSTIKEAIQNIINILMPVVFGLVIAYLLTPVLNFLECHVLNPICKKLKIKDTPKKNKIVRAIGILITAVLFYLVIHIVVAMVLSQIVPSISNIIANSDTYIDNITKWINQLLENNPDERDYALKMINKYSGDLEKFFNENIIKKTSELIMTVSLSIISVIKVAWNLVIGFIISIYVLASKEKFAGQAKKLAYAVFNNDVANIVINDFRFTHKTFIGFIGGKVVDSIIIGILCFIGTSIMHTPYAALVSVTIGVTNVIPFFGPFLGAIPSTLLIFMVDPLHPLNCVYFIIFLLALQQFDGNILGPKILGSSTGLTGFWVIFSITFFGGLFGVSGMIVGVPFFAVIIAAARSAVNVKLKKKNLPIESKNYVDVCMVNNDGLHTYTAIKTNNKKNAEMNHDTWFGSKFICNSDEHMELSNLESNKPKKNIEMEEVEEDSSDTDEFHFE